MDFYDDDDQYYTTITLFNLSQMLCRFVVCDPSSV